MSKKALFEGLIVDEADHPVTVKYVGDDPCYVVDDAGFLRHIPTVDVDRQVLENMEQLITGHEDMISSQAAKMLGQDDIFSVAMIANQLKNLDQQFENLFETGIPAEARAYLGMMGFKIRINFHGEVIDISQPGTEDPERDE